MTTVPGGTPRVCPDGMPMLPQISMWCLAVSWQFEAAGQCRVRLKGDWEY